MSIPLISLNGRWQEASGLPLPAGLAPWILEPASLTARLKQHCQHFRVQLLQEQRAQLPPFLQNLLAETTTAQVREVILWCNDLPCVYAQSWLPQQTIDSLRPLAGLGERPLGDYIFQHSSLQRGTIEAVQLEVALPQLAVPALCYVRRSVFQLEGLPLLVAEAFLPDIARLEKTQL